MNNDQTLAEEATRKSEERHRTILRAAMDGFWLMNLEGQLLEVNDAYCRMSGYSEPELLAMSVADLSILESLEQAASHIAWIMEQGEDRFETRHRRKDGSIIDIEVSAQYQNFEGGRIIVFLRDITDRKRTEEALIASDSFIRSVMDNLPIGIAVNSVDPAVSFLYMNDNFPGFYRTSREALASQDAFWSVVYEDPDFREEVRKRVLGDCASGDPDKMHWIDVPITRNGDETKYIEARNTLLPDKQLMVSTVWDVTARKQAELALLQEQELYEDLVNTLPAGAYRLRVKNRGTWQAETWRAMATTQYSLDFASDRFCAILGIARETLAANPGAVSDLIHPDDKENFDARNAQAMTDFNTFIWEGRIISNKQTRWVHFESVPRAIDPETVLWTGIVYDISELKQAVKEREQFFKFFQTSADLMCLADPNGCFMTTNPSFTETLGYSEAELIARPFVEFIHPDDRQATLDEIARQQQTGFTRNFTNRYVCRDGSIKWLSWRVNYSENYAVAYATARDITDNKRAGEALRESEERMSLALQAGNMGLYDLNVQTGEAVVNPEYALMLGYEPAEFQETNARWIERLHPDDRAPVAAVYQAYVRGELPHYKVEFRQKTKDGDWKWILSYGRIMERDANGNPQRMLGVHIDINERKQAEEALLERKEQLRVIFDTSQAGIIMVAPLGTIQFANNRMAEMFAMPLEQLIGSHYTEHLHETERLDGDERMRELIRGDIQSVSAERNYVRADGSDFWGFLSGKRLENSDGTLRALVGIIADITERKQAEKTLRESENRLRFALEGTNDGLWDVQMKTGTTYLSPRGCEILGYQPDEACEVATDWADLVHPDDLPLTNERLQAHIEGRTPIFEVEQRLRMKSGDWKWVLARGKVVSRDENGIPLRMTGTHTDLTEQKKLQEQLTQAHKMESVGRLAGGVAHDFNNMLSVIIGYTELARKRAPDFLQLPEHLEQIQKAAEHSADIVRQLLAFARKQTVSPKVFDLNNTVDSMIKMLRRLIGEGIELVWHPEEALCPVKMDPVQINQILANLCINARDSITGVGWISIETGSKTLDAAFCARHTGLAPGEYILLTVSDNGSGMDKETLSKIFEPFFTTKGVGQGTGLGLAMVYGIVKQNAGFIDVYSEPGQGTSFTIYLPRYRGKEEKSRLENPVQPAERGQETILLVEDEPALLNLGRQLLEMQGYRVLAASTPGEAIRLAEEHSGEIHLLLTDVVMPEMNGQELAKILLSLYPGLKRLFMSGYTADVIAHHGVLDEGVQFIQKPFSLDALVAKVREALGSKNGALLNGL